MVSISIIAMLILCQVDAGGAAAAPGSFAASPTDQLVSSKIQNRLTKVFDFDERAIGNYESMPAGWRQLNAVRYPRFLEPKFDMKVGYIAPPSFMLPLSGGSLACYYLSNDISVHPDADYEITAWIKPAGLKHARAFIKAYFLDHAMTKINESERRSADVHGATDREDWTEVTIKLPAGFERARWIGLSVHVEQAQTPVPDPDNPRPIDYQDIHATAWFDDIRIVRQPRATLSIGAIGNVFTSEMPVECMAGVTDLDGRGLDTILELHDADGILLQSRVLPVDPLRSPPATIRFTDLLPGSYSLRLIVRAAGGELQHLDESFLVLGKLPVASHAGSSGFGVIADPAAPSHGAISARLTQLSGVQSAKIALWRADMDDDDIVTGDRAADALIRSLRSSGVRIVGALDRPPPSLLLKFGHPGHTVFDVLSTSPDQWRPYLSFLLARYGEEVNAWQIGRIPPDPVSDADKLAASLTNLKAELKPLVGAPRIVIPQEVTTASANPASMPDVISVNVPAHFAADRLLAQLAMAGGGKRPALWATLEDIDSARFDRIPRLSEIARRLILARVAGAESVFVPQPWQITAGDPPQVKPDESFIVLRTIASTLGGLEPICPVWLADSVTAWLFASPGAEEGVLAVWNDAGGPIPRTIVTDSLPNCRHYDLWAREQFPLDRKGGRACRIDVTPSFFLSAQNARVRTVADFAFDPPNVRVQVEKNQTMIRLKNHYATRLSGILKLRPPDSWVVSPKELAIDLAPGQELRTSLSISMPSNFPIGTNVFEALFVREGLRPDDMTLRTPIEVVCPGLDLSVLTRAEGRSLRIIQRLTNRSGHPLDLRSSLIYANDRRETRLIRSLADGQSTLREFEIRDAAGAAGRPIRICTESVSGELKCNQLVTVE